MPYHSKYTKLKGRHIHPRGFSLAQEADMVTKKVLNSSGFFMGHGINNGDGSMENFIGKWNSMNNSNSGRFKRSVHSYEMPSYI